MLNESDNLEETMRKNAEKKKRQEQERLEAEQQKGKFYKSNSRHNKRKK